MGETRREMLCKNIARVLVSFQEQYMDVFDQQAALSGLLCQVWLPHTLEDGTTVQLCTKGQPFFIAGSQGADFLALFRCLSCRFEFGTDGAKPRELGAPGRVYLYSKPEFSSNVQKMDISDYHRQSSAKLCSIQSCILFPLFDASMPEESLGVIEIVQNNDDMDFVRITEMIINNLMRYNLVSCSVDDVRMMMNESHGPLDFQMPGRQDLNVGTMPVAHMATSADVYGNNASNIDDHIGGGMKKSDKSSRRLGTRLSNSNLQNLMKKKKIKTVRKRNMARYEEDVNTSLLRQHEDLYMVPPPICPGMDSRWKRVQEIPDRRRVSTESEDDCPDGAFAITSSRSGKMKYRSKKPSTSSLPARISPSAGDQAVFPQSIPEMASLERVSSRLQSNSKDNSQNSSGREKVESEDWIGMIDPAMVELMMTEDLATDFGDILGDIPDVS